MEKNSDTTRQERFSMASLMAAVVCSNVLFFLYVAPYA